MRTIENYEDFVAAIKDKSSEDRVERNEAKNALGNFRIKYPERFEEYKARCEGVVLQEPISPSLSENYGRSMTKAKYIIEHPEIDIKELQSEARDVLINSSFGRGSRFELPDWVTEEDALISLNLMPLSDLITPNGKLVQRSTLLKLCIQRAAQDGRIDSEVLKKRVRTPINYIEAVNKKTKKYPVPDFYTRKDLVEAFYKITPEEIAKTYNGKWIDADKLYAKALKILKTEQLPFRPF